MPNLSMSPIMPAIMSLLQSQANVRDTNAQADFRQQEVDQAKQNAQQRQVTMQVMADALKGGPGAGQDKSNLPSADDSPIESGRKELATLQKQAGDWNKMANDIIEAGGDPQTANDFRTRANAALMRANSLSREVRLEQANYLKEVGNIAGSARDAESFNTAMTEMRALDPNVDKKYRFDRDVDNNPVWGPQSARTMDTLHQGGMTEKDRSELQYERDNAVALAAADKQKRDEQEAKTRKANADAGLAEINLKRAEQGLPALGRGQQKETPDEKAADRLRAIAEKDPTKDAVVSSQAAVTAYAKEAWGMDKVDEDHFNNYGAFSRDVAAKANQIRADAAKRGQSISLDDAREQAIEELGIFVKDKMVPDPKSKPWFGFGTPDQMKVKTYSRAGGKPSLEKEVAPEMATFMKSLADRKIEFSHNSTDGKPFPMPAKKEVLKKGDIYQTPKGLALWDGAQFVQ